jgi:hypothetical protein
MQFDKLIDQIISMHSGVAPALSGVTNTVPANPSLNFVQHPVGMPGDATQF